MDTLREMIARRKRESKEFYAKYENKPEQLAEDLSKAIRKIEKSGYIVWAYENRDFGRLNEKLPIAYAILHSDYSTVYGLGTCDAETVMRFASAYCDGSTGVVETTTEKIKIKTAQERAAEQEKEREYDLTYNEGGEGYNPYRIGSAQTYREG